MKNIFLFLFLFCLATQSFSQNYLDSTATWGVFSSDEDIRTGQQLYYHYRFYIKGDTLLKGKKYYQIYRYSEELSTSMYWLALREDSLKRFWVIYASFNPATEYLLCDFNKSIGDSVRFSYNYSYFKITSIDTLFLGTRPRKVFHFDNYVLCDDNTLIEGVGYSLGMMHPINCNIDPILTCFEQDNDYLSSYSGSECSLTITPVRIPTSTFTVVSSVCANENAIITYTGNANNFASYSWDFNGGTIVSGVGQGPYQVKWAASGTKNITLKVYDNMVFLWSTQTILPVTVKADTAPAMPIITKNGAVLTSSAVSGNQWYLDGNKITLPHKMEITL